MAMITENGRRVDRTMRAVGAMIAGLALAAAGLAQPSAAPPAAATPGAADATGKPPPSVRMFDTEVDAGQQIAAALRRCKRDNTRVLLEWGHNSYPQSVAFRKQVEADEALKKLISYEYEHILVDYGQPPGKNVPLSRQYQADPHNDGIPYLTVLDAEGRMFANFSVKPFETRGADGSFSYDLSQVAKFLQANKAAPVAAQSKLDRALAAAKREEKKVYVHFGAPWCPWCHKLDDFLSRPDVAATLGQDFVFVKIDTDRNPGGQAMLDRLSEKKADGIPFSVIVGVDGQVIAPGFDVEGQNFGFPVEATEREGFAAMLKKAAKNLTPKQIDEVVEKLKGAE
jgi:thiol-disulfide isomerase/thioredoxin